MKNKNKKCTRKNFEQSIREKLDIKCIEYSPYRYSDYQDCDAWGNPKQKAMTLYYHNDIHIASWQRGSGWFIEGGWK